MDAPTGSVSRSSLSSAAVPSSVGRPPSPPLDLRALALQAVALLAVLALLAWLVRNAAGNLAGRNVASGFGFLKDSAGFAISEGLVPYETGDSYLRALIAGAANTLRAAIPAVLLASLLGFSAGIAQISRNALVRTIARTYVDVVRNVPLLVQVLMWYIVVTESLPAGDSPLTAGGVAFLSKGGLAVAVPEVSWPLVLVLSGVTLALPVLAWRSTSRRRTAARVLAMAAALAACVAAWVVLPSAWERPTQGSFGVSGGATLSPEWLALVCALTLYAGAYCAEIVRSGIQAVHKGQWEACHALGLTRPQMLMRVIVPQSLRVIVPPYTSLIMNTIKNSSLAVAIGYPDIVSIATTAMNQNGQAIECVAVIAGVYLTLNLFTALVMGIVNARAQLKER